MGSAEEAANEGGEQVDESDEDKVLKKVIAELTIEVMKSPTNGWKASKVLGNGANGVVLAVQKKDRKAVMKVALNEVTSNSLMWESLVMATVGDHKKHLEPRHLHLVRAIDSGKEKYTIDGKSIVLHNVVMENLPGNPVPNIGNATGAGYNEAIYSFTIQLLKAVSDLHQMGFLHRDIKPENIGLYKEKSLVLYDLGMARQYLTKDGILRVPRHHCGMRGTDEWCSLTSENGHDQGRLDDLMGVLYVVNEWINCRSQAPQAWSILAKKGNEFMRHFMKTNFFQSNVVLNNCPFIVFRMNIYLKTLGRFDTPDYFYLACIFMESRSFVRTPPKPASPPIASDLREYYCPFALLSE